MPQQLASAKVSAIDARTLLPRDHKIRVASAEFSRDLEELIQLQRSFEKRWFSDEPEFDAGRADLREIRSGLVRARNSLLELLHLTSP